MRSPHERGPIPTPAFGERVVGAAAIALVASLVIQNAVFVWARPPGYGDPIEKVLAWHAVHRGWSRSRSARRR